MDLKIDGFIYQYQSFGGISRIFTEILPRMCEIDPTLQITIFTSGRCQQNVPTHPGIKHQALLPIDDLNRPYRLWLPIQQPLRRLLQWAATDLSQEAVWHSTYLTMPIRWNGPTVITVYDMIPERYPDLFPSPYHERFKRQKQRSVLAADKVICISETTRKDVQNYYGIMGIKLQAIPLAFNHDFRRLESDTCSQKLPIDKPFLLYVGRRSIYKNFKTLLQAYSVWKRRNEIDLLVVGPDWSDQEQRWLVDKECLEQVHLLQRIDDQLLACLYNRAQAFVYPSLFEGFGIPLLEAMACGCPVVASRIPTTVEVAGEHPFYFEPTDIDELLEALDAALAEGQHPERVESGIRKAQQYSWDDAAKKTLDVYHSLANT
jgi:glycosyltransferase involved in cell wall biosynthesis